MASSVKLYINCDDPWFTLIENGNKKVEGRKGQQKYRDLKPNDIVHFCCTGRPDRKFLAQVERVDHYKTLIDYLKEVGVENALPGVTTLDEGVRTYLKWSTEKEIDPLGFVAIWIKVL